MTEVTNLVKEAQPLVGKTVSVGGWHEAYAPIGYRGVITGIRIGQYTNKVEAVVQSTDDKEESFNLCGVTLKRLLEDGKSETGNHQWSRSGMTIQLL